MSAEISGFMEIPKQCKHHCLRIEESTRNTNRHSSRKNFGGRSDQEGRMKGVELRRRMLGDSQIFARCLGKLRNEGRRQNIGNKQYRRMQGNVSRRQNARRLRRSHRLAAVMALVRSITRHRTTTLHALLVLRHGRHAVCELREQYRRHGQHNKCGFPHHLFKLYEF